MKLRSLFPLALGTLLLASLPAHADSTEDILEMLVNKGVLTKEEVAKIADRRKTEKVADEESHKADIRPVFKDGIRLESADKSQSLGFNGRIQADYATSTRTPLKAPIPLISAAPS